MAVPPASAQTAGSTLDLMAERCRCGRATGEGERVIHEVDCLLVPPEAVEATAADDSAARATGAAGSPGAADGADGAEADGAASEDDADAGQLPAPRIPSTLAALVARSQARLDPGSVALVGGGPGAEDLITVRGMALLEQADVVVVDRLAPAGLAAQLGPGVEVIEVGKTPGQHSIKQPQIERLLVERAHAGKRVVRLKGGDPYVLGRGGEEVLACRAAGVPVQVVPGVTSATAGPLAGEIPVTHRGTAVAVHIVNAHGDLGPADLAALADPATTTVLMMGVDWLPRLRAQALLNGISPDLPVAVVHSATLEQERTVRGTLDTIAEVVRQEAITFPSVIILGRTAAPGFLLPPEPARPRRGSGREALLTPPDSPAPDQAAEQLDEADDSTGQHPRGGAAGPVLVGCAHGTRSRRGRDIVRRILMDVRRQLPEVEVREAYVDVQQPEVARAVEDNAAPSLRARTRDQDGEPLDAVVVPLLLSTGYHVRHDIGRAIKHRRAYCAPPLGPDPRLARILAERLEQTGVDTQDPRTAIVLGVAGTSDSQGQEMGRAMAAHLAEYLGREVSIGFLAAAEPSLPQAVEEARRAGARRVAVSAYLLTRGYFYDVATQAGADVISAPIGVHPLLTQVIIDRYHAATGS